MDQYGQGGFSEPVRLEGGVFREAATWVFGTVTQAAGAGRRGRQRPGLRAAGSGGPGSAASRPYGLRSSVAPLALSQQQRGDRCSD